MKPIDKLAEAFVREHGEYLRSCSYDALYTEDQSQEGERQVLFASDELAPFTFAIRRARYGDGIIRVYVEGERSGWLGSSFRVVDAFDIHPDGRVREIPVNDEDWCGRT